MGDLVRRRAGATWEAGSLDAIRWRAIERWRDVVDAFRAASWLVAPLTIGIASRAYASLLIQIATAAGSLSLPTLTDASGAYVAWDGQWYLSVARTGYHALPIQTGGLTGHHDFAFFPFWPVVLRVLSVVPLPAGTVSFVIANVFFVIATVVVWRILARAFDPDVATGGLALLAFSPAAFVFSMAYSESLFLLLAGIALASAGRPGQRALATWLAMLTRIMGAALVVSSMLQAAIEGWRGRRTEAIAAAVSAGFGVAAFAAWWLVVALITGHPLGFMEGSPGWYVTSGWPAVEHAISQLTLESAVQLAVPVVILVGAIVALRRNLELGSYALTVALLGLLPGGGVSSMPRYALLSFPAFAGLSRLLGRRGTLLLVFVSALLQWYAIRWTFGLQQPGPP